MRILIFMALTSIAYGEALLVNGGFDDDGAGWTSTGELSGMVCDVDPRGYGHIQVPDDSEIGYPRWEQSFSATPGAVYFAGASVLSQGVHGRYGAYVSLGWYDAAGERISFDQSSPTHVEMAWTPLTVRSVAPPDAVEGRFNLILNGHGDAFFDNATLVLEKVPFDVAPATGPVSMTVTPTTVCENFLGFGAEDDGWFYSVRNCRKGVTEKDHALREARITHMDPDWVRMFFWYKDWDAREDDAHYNFDSPNMRSHFQALDVYQRIGAAVNVVGVEWFVDAPFGDPARRARSIGALLEHLIRERGYTCIQYWTLTNEPNLGFLQTGATFADYVEIHRLVAEEIAARGLNVKIVGSDNTGNGLNWLLDCIRTPEYHAVADVYASHVYLKRDARVLATNFFTDHLSALQGDKPWVIAEFGFQDGESTHRHNPVMERWDYALWTMAFVIEGLNRGVAGFNIWCLDETYYPGGPIMNYGLWRYKDAGWMPKPVYHAWANFTRHTEAGERVHLVNSSDPARVNGAYVGDTFFWVNLSGADVEVEVQETTAQEAVIYAEGAGDVVDTLPPDDPSVNDVAIGMHVRTIDLERFTAPARSFGYLR